MNVRSADLILAAIAAGLLLSFALALQYVPRLYPPDPNLPSTAAILGYNISLAYWKFLALLGAGGLLVSLAGMRSKAVPPDTAHHSRRAKPRGWLLWLERFGMVGLVTVLYWPGALARFGPHIEADYFINVLWRMVCGQAPYTDFEFLYGPLMLGLAEAWISVTGYSMESYYTYYFLLQLLFFGTLLLVLQAYIRTPWKRYCALLVLLPFAFDSLLGLNWMAWRYFLAPLAILTAAAKPGSIRYGLMAGAMVGVQLAVSHEYGIAALVSVLAIYGMNLFYPHRWAAIRAGAAAVALSIAVWAALAWAATGSGFGDYLGMMAEVSARSGRLGIGQFAFHWTIHSAALFAVLCCVVACFSGSLRQLGKTPLAAGDLHLIGASVFLAATMRIALQRPDFYHMAIPFLPLMLAVLINQPRSLLWQSRTLQSLTVTAVVVAAVAHTAGHSHIARWQLQNQARGIVHELQNRPTAGPIVARGQSILTEHYQNNPDLAAVAERLTEPDLNDRPVFFYYNAWAWPARTGICPAGYSFYDLLYATDRAPHSAMLDKNPNMVVVMHRRDYNQLWGANPPVAEKRAFTDNRKVLNWVSSPNYAQGSFENRIEYFMWANSIGYRLKEHYEPVFEHGQAMVLLQKQ